MAGGLAGGDLAAAPVGPPSAGDLGQRGNDEAKLLGDFITGGLLGAAVVVGS
jgi:hypothetical protein